LSGRPVARPCPACGREFLLENPALNKNPEAPPLICSVKGCPGLGGGPDAPDGDKPAARGTRRGRTVDREIKI
jgi:hypothetical protein